MQDDDDDDEVHSHKVLLHVSSQDQLDYCLAQLVILGLQ
jgi:hypothetical protein